MASLNDQFEHGRIPIKPLPYKNRDLSQCNEILIDYGGDDPNHEPNYHIYITHHNDPNKYIDITSLIIKEMLPNAEINANQFTITIEGNKDPQSLMDIINYIWKRFSHAEDPSGFVYEDDRDLIYDPTTVSVLLQTTDGQIQLPITLADNVYDKSGNSIQDRLDNMTRLGFSVSYLYATQDNQTSFEFNYPFEDYPDMLEVRIGTTYIDRSRYQITRHYNAEGHYISATLDFIGESIENGRRIDLVWIFNSLYEDEATAVSFMSGSRIADSSVSIYKLEKYSDSYSYNDSNSVATSKALVNLYNHLSEVINANNQNMFTYIDVSSSNNDSIGIKADKKPNDGDIIIVTTSSLKSSTVNLVINAPVDLAGMVISALFYYNIKTPDGNNLVRGFANNQVLKFKIEGENAILISGISGEIRSNKFMHDCIDQELTISYKGLDYNSGDLIHVYRNGVRLFQDIDYSTNYTDETITLFVRTEQGERIVFESLGV